MKRTGERKIRWIDPRLPEVEYNRIAFDHLKANVKILDSGCWEWQRWVFPAPNAYGGMSYRGKQWRTHRLAYHLAKGPIPDGLDILHKCDYKRCCNPEHLFAGTHRENMLDMRDKGKMHQHRVTHCPRGHAYDEKNTVWKVTKIGGQARECKPCTLLRSRVRARLKLGWPRQLAVSVPPVPKGYRLVAHFIDESQHVS